MSISALQNKDAQSREPDWSWGLGLALNSRKAFKRVSRSKHVKPIFCSGRSHLWVWLQHTRSYRFCFFWYFKMFQHLHSTSQYFTEVRSSSLTGSDKRTMVDCWWLWWHFSLFCTQTPWQLKAFKTRPFVDGAKTLIGGQVPLGGFVAECFGLLIWGVLCLVWFDMIWDVVIRDWNWRVLLWMVLGPTSRTTNRINDMDKSSPYFSLIGNWCLWENRVVYLVLQF